MRKSIVIAIMAGGLALGAAGAASAHGTHTNVYVDLSPYGWFGYAPYGHSRYYGHHHHGKRYGYARGYRHGWRNSHHFDRHDRYRHRDRRHDRRPDRRHDRDYDRRHR